MTKRAILRRLFLLFLLLVLLPSWHDVGCQTQEKQKSPRQQEAGSAEEKNAPPVNVFKNQETVKFGVYSGGLKIGSGRLSYLGPVSCGRRPLQHISFLATTFSVEDREDVFGTLDFSSPVRVERYVKLFGRRELISENYSDNAASVTIAKNVNGRDTPPQTISSSSPLRNVLLIIYKIRNERNLKEGSVFKIVLPTQEFNLYVREKRKIKVPLGTFEAIYLESQPAKYRIWLNASGDRLPLRIQGLVAGGTTYLAATEVL